MSSMSRTTTLAVGISLASGALLTAWLLTGDRKEKTKQLVSKSTVSLKKVLQKERILFDDADVYYI